MHLWLHDSEIGNSLCAGVKDLDYLYQAEQWIEETKDQSQVVKWILTETDDKDSKVIATWERPTGSLETPTRVLIEEATPVEK